MKGLVPSLIYYQEDYVYGMDKYTFPGNLFFFFFNLFLWLCWVFVSVRGLSLVAASGGHSSSRYAGLSLSQPLLLRSTGSRRASPVIHTDLVTPQHVGSSQTRARTRVPCTGRQTLNHCATREAPRESLIGSFVTDKAVVLPSNFGAV